MPSSVTWIQLKFSGALKLNRNRAFSVDQPAGKNKKQSPTLFCLNWPRRAQHSWVFTLFYCGSTVSSSRWDTRAACAGSTALLVTIQMSVKKNKKFLQDSVEERLPAAAALKWRPRALDKRFEWTARQVLHWEATTWKQIVIPRNNAGWRDSVIKAFCGGRLLKVVVGDLSSAIQTHCFIITYGGAWCIWEWRACWGKLQRGTFVLLL